MEASKNMSCPSLGYMGRVFQQKRETLRIFKDIYTILAYLTAAGLLTSSHAGPPNVWNLQTRLGLLLQWWPGQGTVWGATEAVGLLAENAGAERSVRW